MIIWGILISWIILQNLNVITVHVYTAYSDNRCLGSCSDVFFGEKEIEKSWGPLYPNDQMALRVQINYLNKFVTCFLLYLTVYPFSSSLFLSSFLSPEKVLLQSDQCVFSSSLSAAERLLACRRDLTEIMVRVRMLLSEPLLKESAFHTISSALHTTVQP